MLRQYQQPLQVTSWSTSTRTPTSRSISGCGCWRRRRAEHACTAVTFARERREVAREAAASEDERCAAGLAAEAPTPDPHPERDGEPERCEGRGRDGAAREPKNICCVGDDDQSIYGWRGAEVDNILRFEHDFPGAKVIRLERNYRSTGHILAAASHLIAHNEGRLGKTLRTEDVPGEKVSVTGAWDSEEEARAIGEEIEQLQRAARDAARTIRSTRSPSWCAPRSRCASSKTASSRSACPIA